jgi:uroporphyrinogen-III synthase
VPEAARRERAPARGQRGGRDEPPGGPLSRLLEAQGARVLAWPTIALEPPLDPAPLERALAALDGYDWLLVTSPRAVAALAARIPRLPGRLKVAAVGASTAAAAREAGWRVDRVPEEFRGEMLAATFAAAGDAPGARVLYPAADRASDELQNALGALGARVERVEAYRIVTAPLDAAACFEAAERGGVDAVTFASPSAVEGLATALGEPGLTRLLERVPAVVIGPTTERALTRRGLAVGAVAHPSTLDGLVEAVVEVRARLATGTQRG